MGLLLTVVEVIFARVSLIFLLRMFGCHGFNIGSVTSSFPFRTWMSTGKVYIIAVTVVARMRRRIEAVVAEVVISTDETTATVDANTAGCRSNKVL